MYGYIAVLRIHLRTQYPCLFVAVGGRSHRRHRHNELGGRTMLQHHVGGDDFFKENNLSELTVADLKTVIDTEFPVRTIIII